LGLDHKVDIHVLIIFYFSPFPNIFFIFFLLQQHIRRKHTKFQIFFTKKCPLEFLQVCPKIGINVWKMTNPISKTNLGILETANPASQRESNAKFNSVRFEKNGPDSSCEAKVMVVLSLDSDSGFLAWRWMGGGGFVGMVGLVIGSVYRD
jgi:hypothetical protein